MLVAIDGTEEKDGMGWGESDVGEKKHCYTIPKAYLASVTVHMVCSLEGGC